MYNKVYYFTHTYICLRNFVAGTRDNEEPGKPKSANLVHAFLKAGNFRKENVIFVLSKFRWSF